MSDVKYHYEMNLIKLYDLYQVERVGKACLPIYYSMIELLFMIPDKNQIMWKVVTKDLGDNQTNVHDLPIIYVGYLIAEKKNMGKRIHLKSIAVLNTHRRRGIASSFLNRLKKVDGCEELTLYVMVTNNDAIKFYQSHGFKIEKTLKGYYRMLNTNYDNNDDYDAYMMKLILS